MYINMKLQYFLIAILMCISTLSVQALTLGNPDKTEPNVIMYPIGYGETAHADIWNYTSVGYTVPITSSDVYVNVTGLVPQNLHNFKYNTTLSTLTVQIPGTYSIDWSMSFSGGNNNEYGMGVVKNYNMSMSRECYARRTTSSNAVDSVSGHCVMNLYPNDKLSFQVDDEANPAVSISIRTIAIVVFKEDDIN